MADNKFQQEFEKIQKEKTVIESNLKQMSTDEARLEGKIREQERSKERAAEALKKEEEKLAELTREKDALSVKKEESERRLGEHNQNLERTRMDIERMQEEEKK